MTTQTRIAVLGSGAMGSLFGGRLAASGMDVSLVHRRSAPVEAVNRSGLTIRSAAGDELTVEVPATTDPATVGPVGLVVVFVKSHQTESALEGASALLEGGPDVLTLQNGLGNPETIAEFVPEANVLAGVTTQGATREAPGRVFHAGDGPTTIGRYFTENDDRVRTVATWFEEAGIETTVSDAVLDEIWEKVLVNVAINAPTALARVPNGTLASTDPGRRVLESAVKEAARVARTEGREVPADVVSLALDVARATAENRSSMLQDVEAGRKTEIEQLHGEIVERAEALGLQTPINRTLADLVRLAEAGFSTPDPD